MVISVKKIVGLFPKSPSKEEHHLHDFRSTVSDIVSQALSEQGSLSLSGLQKCFDIINGTSRAFAALVAEVGCPISQWGGRTTEEYLNYSFNLLGLLNLITSSIAHIRQAKVEMLYSLSLIKKNSKNLVKMKIQGKKIGEKIRLEGPIRLDEMPGSEKEIRVFQGMIVSRKIVLLVLGFVLAGLCGDAKPYREIRTSEACEGIEDSVIKSLDLRLGKVMIEIQELEEVKGVYRAVESEVTVEELKRRLEVLENSIQLIEKRVNNLFSEVVCTRNVLLDNVRSL